MDLIEAASPPPATVMACGPRPMLAAVARWAAERAIACLVSLETVFGCGTGLCGGCAVPAAGEPRHYLWACREGPVLEAQRLDWEAWSETCAP
jgi:dihydroorotate dehydrogenase electron transfer subunit